MDFTYKAIEQLISDIRRNGYSFEDYNSYINVPRSIILRHDVDDSLDAAVQFSEFEANIIGTNEHKATYFVLLSTNMYNVFSTESREKLRSIIRNGGRIGLHFDECQYNITCEDDIVDKILYEKEILENVLEMTIDSVSMHRPSKDMHVSQIMIPGTINSYSETFFKGMKYLSDSRRRFREDVEGIIDGGVHDRIHLLLHPFWYRYENANSISEAIRMQLVDAIGDRYNIVKDNTSNFDEIISENEVRNMMDRAYGKSL